MASAPKQVRRTDIKPRYVLRASGSWNGSPLATTVRYVGSGKHKTYPPPDGPAAWTPVWPDDGETERCAHYDRSQWAELGRLLASAIAGGFIAADKLGRPVLADDGYPSAAWAWVGDVLHEARYTQNREYHAFPLTREECWPHDRDNRLAKAPRWDP